jgi:hypothetical protein
VIIPKKYLQEINLEHTHLRMKDVDSSKSNQQAIVYIAGRTKKGSGDSSLLDELYLSVISACHAQSKTLNSTTIEQSRLDFVFFVSEYDFYLCNNSSATCEYLQIEQACKTWLPPSNFKFKFAPLNIDILKLWKENTGIVGFSHHSTWYGYAKVWLPVLPAMNSFSSALFVDTDTLWNHAPSNIFDEMLHFNSTQVIGATSIVPRHNGHTSSLSFKNRVTSGVLLFDLNKFRRSIKWVDIVKSSVTANRGGIAPGEMIPSNYNQSAHCEGFHWGPFLKPFCLMDPFFVDSNSTNIQKLENFKLSGENSLIRDCGSTRCCWKTSPESGDQEFFSDIFSNQNPELLYELPHKHQVIKMGRWKDFAGFNNDTSMTLIHAPAMSDLWNKNPALSNDELINVLPPTAYQSLIWFRRHVMLFE